MQDEICQERTSVGVKQPIQGSPDAVVVQLAELRWGAAQQGGRHVRGPFDDGIQKAFGRE
jgi:hypothetical protein